MRGKRLTKELLREHFGSGVRIRGFLGPPYRVTTPNGGEVVIKRNDLKVRSGDDAVYRACTLLANDLWGRMTVRGGREFVLGMMAHGEALGVNVRADHTNRWATVLRAVVVLGVLAAGKAISGQDGSGTIATICLAALIWWAMQRSAKREERRKAQQMGFHYPRVQGMAGATSHDDAKRKGWV